MTENRRKSAPDLHPLMKTGLTVIAISALWWLVYYAQWQGPVAHLAAKFNCLATESSECEDIRYSIGNSLIPMYQPGAWWGGIMCGLAGWFLARHAGRKA
ncbi:MAG: hypothetical protein P4M09_04510 [Devosia sp.]|nr:hypothetical protein [Devosia sp.]